MSENLNYLKITRRSKYFAFLSLSLFLLAALPGRSQLAVVQGAALNMTPEELVANWLVGNGVEISNVTFNGSSAPISSNQIGTFVASLGARAELELASGIVMTSGTAANTIGPNNVCGKSASTGSGGDPDLTILAGVNTNDKAVLEFDFVPQSDTLKFRYVFGSEEIWTYCYSYNDAFGFFLSGPGISGTFSNNSVNIALMPGTSNWVTLNNMCNFPESMWCNAPVLCPHSPPPPPSYINCTNPKGSGVYLQYNGLTYVYTAWHVVIPCSTYHIKLAVGDALDSALDSGVFLEKNSFSAVGMTVETNFSIPSLGERAIEACSDALVNIIFPSPFGENYTVHFTIGGTAINGVDYTLIPDSVVIPAGQSSATVTIDPFYDGITEGVEIATLTFLIGGCSTTDTIIDTIKIADNNPLLASAGPDDTICRGDTATLTATAWGGQRPFLYNWLGFGGGDSIIQVSPPAGTAIYELKVTDGCGVNEYDTMELLVKPLPSISVGSYTSPLCSGYTVVIPLAASLPNSMISWISSSPSGQVTGHSSGTGDTIVHTLVNLGYVLDSVRYTIVAQADGCTGKDTSIWVYVRPTPDILFIPVSYSLCNGQTTEITLSSNVSGTSFSWTATCSNPNISGYSDGAGDTIKQTLFTSDQYPDTVFYHVTATADGCSSLVTDYPVVVNPVPSLTVNPMLDTICSEEYTGIQLTASCFGTFFIWTAAQGAGNISGYSDGSGPVIDQQLFNLVPSNGSVLYTITPSTSTCTGLDTTFTMWVKPRPHVTNSPQGDSVCNETTLNIPLTSDVPGTTFTWICTPSSPDITGWANQGTPALVIDHTLINNGSAIETVTYHITPYHTGCDGPLFDYTVTVYPTPTLTNSPAEQSICSSQVLALNLTSDVAGTTFTWNAFSSSPSTAGYHANAGPGTTLIGDTLVNSGFGVDTVTYRILPMANNCTGDSTDYRVVVYPVPDLSNPVTTQSQCSGQSTNITLLSNISGTLFTWTAFASSSYISGFSNSTTPGTLINHTLINSGTSTDTVTYLIVPHANGCSGDTIPYQVIVFPVPDVQFLPDGDTLCSRQTSSITISSQVGGTTFIWTATGSSPSITGYGSGSGNLIQQQLFNAGYLPGWVTYDVAPSANGCPGIPNAVMVTVDPVPLVSLAVCFDTMTTTGAQPIWLSGGVPLTGTYTGTGISGRQFYPALAGAGAHTVTYSYQNNYTCLDSASLIIQVANPIPFTCGDPLSDVRDNRTYPTVQIGSQCWIAVNLNYGTVIASSLSQRDNCINEKYCFNDNPASCTSYGGLYQWGEMMRYRSFEGEQGLCPPGWHVPTEGEWNTLFTNFISNGFAGNALKSSGYSGFNAFMTGIRFHHSVWKFSSADPVLRSKLYWSSTVHGPFKAWAHGMNEVVADIEYTPSVSFYPALQSNAFAVRCLKD